MWQKITENLQIDVRDEWLELFSEVDDQFISVSPDEIEPLITALRKARILLTPVAVDRQTTAATEL